MVCTEFLLGCNEQSANERPSKETPKSTANFSSPEDYSFENPVQNSVDTVVAVDSLVQDSLQDSVVQDTVVAIDSVPASVPEKAKPAPRRVAKPVEQPVEKEPAIDSAAIARADSLVKDSLAKDSVAKALCSDVGASQICDMRDGKRYRYVKIGKQTWMSQNLAYKVDGSWCVNGNAEGCAQYGRLYEWNVANSCPVGWRLPSMEDFTILKSHIEKKLAGKSGVGTALKTITGWEEDDDGLTPVGTNEFGFAAKPAGYRDYRGNFVSVGSEANFWTSQEVPGEDRASYWNLYFANQDFIGSYVGLKTSAMSVRCIKE